MPGVSDICQLTVGTYCEIWFSRVSAMKLQDFLRLIAKLDPLSLIVAFPINY